MDKQFIEMSPNGDALELSLDVGTSPHELMAQINQRYDVTLDFDRFNYNIVYLGQDNFLRLDIYSKETGSLEWIFKDRQKTIRSLDLDGFINNPKNFLFQEVSDNFQIFINTKKELDFLKSCELNVKNNTLEVRNYNSRKLADLLNTYDIQSGWSSDPYSSRTTYQFILRYLGGGDLAPLEYSFLPNQSIIAVVEVMIDGVYKTLLLAVG